MATQVKMSFNDVITHKPTHWRLRTRIQLYTMLDSLSARTSFARLHKLLAFTPQWIIWTTVESYRTMCNHVPNFQLLKQHLSITQYVHPLPSLRTKLLIYEMRALALA